MLIKFSQKILIFILTFFPIFLFLIFLKKNSSETVTLNVYNWGDFMSLGGDSGENVNELFTQKTGIKINYTTFQSNEEMMAKIMGGGAEYDVIFPSDYCVSKLIDNDLLAEINFNNIPNYKLVSPDLKNLEFNPDGKKYVAYSWGVLGIFYNKDYVKEKITWDLLWNQKYKNKILMLDNPRDALSISLLRKKKSINSEKIKDWAEAAEDLQNQKSLVSNYMSDQIFDKLIGEEDYIAPFYYGHSPQNDVLKESPNIKFDVPKEGTNKFIDCICILKSSKHKKEAEEYINFLCGNEISYINSKVTGYFPANQNVAEKLIEKSEFLNSYDKNKFYVYKDLSPEISKFTDGAWVNIKAGNKKFHFQNLVLILIFLSLIVSYVAILIAKIKKRVGVIRVFKVSFKKEKFDKNISLLDFAKISGIENPCAAKIEGKIFELSHNLSNDCEVEFLTFDDIEGRRIYFHTACHVMAQAIKRIYPKAKLGFGPPTDLGFFYDIDFSEENFSKDDIPKIESEMKKIISENLTVSKKEVSLSEAKKIMQGRNENYKIELINDLGSNQKSITLRSQGEFVDICKGPHVPSTGCIGVIHISNVTGAYWKGDQKNKMLTRIYGYAFPSEEQYQKFIKNLEENYKRDHNKIGRALGYFTTVDYIGQGLPILMPKGSRVIQIMQRFVEDEEEKRGYLLTKTPFLAKSDLYKISGHWYHYKENMFTLGEEKKESEQFALRPMTCPFQFQVYLSKERSYRDLPMRLNETSTLFRNEQSGEMHGLIRLRQFTISEGHIACTPEQLATEFKECLELAQFMMKTFKIENDVYYRFSKWDKNDKEKYIGSADEWNKVQNTMKKILDSCNLEYTEVDGEAAFYGPKLDIQFRNVYGKEDTLITVQIDFQLAKKFEMSYVDKDGTKKYAYVIHRTSLGCYERTLALLLEKYAGLMPLWLAPEQIRILPMNENMVKNASDIKSEIQSCGIKRVEIDKSNEKIGYKIRLAQEEKVPYMIILGSKEIENNTLSVRSNKNGDLGSMKFDEFVSMIKKEIDNKE